MVSPKNIYRFIRGVILIPWWGIWQVIMVFVYGAWKHRNDLWIDEDYDWGWYENKVDRHRIRRWFGSMEDDETGRPHHAHACCDLIMAMNRDKMNDMSHTAMSCVNSRTFPPEVIDHL